jgi:TP901 family phage tail tape measure protein
MDVNLPQAENLLANFSKTAVAGNVSLEASGRATIAILNGLRIPVEQVGHVQDIMFQLVRKGVGTYEEFATSIGRAIPATSRFGQRVEDLSGMMAFLTRNGLSADMAATSAARAMEAMAKPVVAKRMKELGVNVLDSAGNYRQMSDIMIDLGSAMADMSKPERAAALDAIFKGAGGTIQARRFFDTAITGFRELEGFTDHMENAGGALQGAYDIMFEQPQNQIQLMRNKLDVLKTTVGDALIPILLQLLGVVSKVVDWWNGLSKGTQALIVKIALITSVFAVVTGVVLFFVGTILSIIGAMVMMGASVGGAILIFGGFLAALALIPVIIALVIIHFDKIKAAASAVAAWFMENVWPTIQEFIDYLKEQFANLVQWWVDNWDSIKEAADHIWRVISEILKAAWDFISAMWRAWGDDLMKIAKAAWELIRTVIKSVIDVIRNIIQLVMALINGDWGKAWDAIKGILAAVWDFMFGIVKFAIQFVMGLITGFVSQLIAVWQGLWDKIKEILDFAWDLLVRGVSNGFDAVMNFFKEFPQKALDVLGGVGRKFFDAGVQLIQYIIDGVKSMATNIGTAFVDTITGAIPGGGLVKSGLERFGIKLGGDINGAFRGTAIGPGDAGAGAVMGGKALSRVLSVLPKGLRISSTYRTPARNRAVGGVPNSLHLDRNNPAVDISGPTAILNSFASRLRAMGGWRQLLWRVAGHFDHIHVAHAGGTVSSGWGTLPGLRSDERPVIAQVGETILPRGASVGGITINVAGNIYGVVDLKRTVHEALDEYDANLERALRS